MPSDLKLTAAGILAHVLETSGIQVGTTIDRKDLENMAASLDGQLSALIAAAKATTSAEQRAVEAEGRVKELTAAMESIRDVKDEIGGDDSDQMVYVLHVACTALAQPPESKEPSIYNRMTCPTCGSDLVPTAGPLSNIWKCPKCKESKIPPCPSPASPNCDCAECKMWEEPRP